MWSQIQTTPEKYFSGLWNCQTSRIVQTQPWSSKICYETSSISRANNIASQTKNRGYKNQQTKSNQVIWTQEFVTDVQWDSKNYQDLKLRTGSFISANCFIVLIWGFISLNCQQNWEENSNSGVFNLISTQPLHDLCLLLENQFSQTSSEQS